MYNLSNKDLIKEKFSKYVSTYDSYALIQKKVVYDFIKNIEKYISDEIYLKNKYILEIGSGSGLLSKELNNIFIDSTIIYSDLTNIILKNLKSKIKSKNNNKIIYNVIDGESYNTSKNFDYIISSSTFQWFVFLKDSFVNLSKHLKKNGYFIFSMFTGDTLKYFYLFLKQVKNNSNIPVYYKYKDIIKYLKELNFNIIYSKEIKYKTEYQTVSDLLKMMKYTGTTGLKLIENTITKTDLKRLEDLYVKKYNTINEYFYSSFFIAKKIKL